MPCPCRAHAVPMLCPCRSHAIPMPCPCRTHAVPMPRPCHTALFHTCHAAPLPFSGSAMSFVKVRMVVGRIRTRSGRPHAVSGRPMLNHIYHAHAALCRGLKKSLSERHGHGTARARYGMCESNMAALSKSNGKDTI
jgi:hypothetical protein